MPHAGWAESLVVDGTDLTMATPGYLLRLVRGPYDVPSVRGGDTVVPGLAGRIPGNRVADTLLLEAEGYVFGRGADETEQRNDVVDLRTALKALMDPTQSPYSINATLADGTSKVYTARPRNIVWTEVIPTIWRASLEWECVDAADFF